jgi:bile acid:Na+ symporter, BASS family
MATSSKHGGHWLSVPVHFVHQNLLAFLLGLYVLAYVLPQPGLWIRNCNFGSITWFDGSHLVLSLPVFMLSFLLLNAGLGTKAQELLLLKKKPQLLIAGVLANTFVPLLFILGFSFMGHYWHSSNELQMSLMGLALVASMPIAGSSTAWAQNMNGNLSLSLSLVFVTTAVSPWLTPLVLHAIGFLATGDAAEDLHELANQGAGAFLILSVVLPSIAGVLLQKILSARMTHRLMPYIKCFNLINMLMLSYSNAAISLPAAFTHPDWDFLIMIFIVSSAYCAIAFGSGWLIAQKLRANSAEKASLMFGLGMNNNGSGLVLSSIALADHPQVMIPIIFYNLSQQVFAGVVDKMLSKEVGDDVDQFSE